MHLGPPWVRAFGPLGLVRWQGAAGPSCTIRIVPAVGTARALLPHPDPRTAAGAHLARLPGDGIEFAEARPYQPGDRLRSVNWALSTRRGDLWVNERRPERSSDLVVLIDTFADDAPGRRPGAVPDRRAPPGCWPQRTSAPTTGWASSGSVAIRRGSPPAAGSGRASQLLDRLLATSAAWTEAQRSARMLPRQALPPGALVVAVSPLHDHRMVGAVGDLRRRGMAVAVVRVDVEDLLPQRPIRCGRRPCGCGRWSWTGGRRCSAMPASPW